MAQIDPKYLLLGLCTTLAVACSATPTPSFTTIPAAKYSLTLKVNGNDSATKIAQEYAGTIIAWHPDDGFAILGVNQAPAQDERWLGLEENNGSLNNPEVQPGSDLALPVPESVQSDGAYWSSGWTGWNNSVSSVWAGGIKVWVTGNGILPTREQNTAVWEALNLQTAWNNSSKLGDGIKVAVIDTGIDVAHPIFQGRLAPADEWADFVSYDAFPQEEGQPTDAAFGHGTGIAGLIAQVAPKAKILPIRVLNSNGQGDELELVTALGWAIAKKANIINLSLGSRQSSIGIDLMIQAATRLGIVVVASVGNNNKYGSNFPASSALGNPKVLAVGSSTFRKGFLGTTYSRSWYSNYGGEVSAVVPGENLFSSFPGNAGKVWNGTSFSTALMSGAMALRMAQKPLSTTPSLMVKSSSTGLLGTPDLATQVNFACYCGEIDFGRLQTR
jgi:thermitase